MRKNLWIDLKEMETLVSFLAEKVNIKVNFEKNLYIDNDTGVWNTSPMQLIVTSFRKNMQEDKKAMATDEYVYIKKLFSEKGHYLPFTRKEYGEYFSFLSRNAMILDAIEQLYEENAENIFKIPSHDEAKEAFGLAYEYMMEFCRDIFLYSGSKARCMLDIEGNISGFDVYAKFGSLFIPMYGNRNSGAYYIRPSIKRIPPVKATIMPLGKSDVLLSDSIIAIDTAHPESIVPISKYFDVFDIISTDMQYMMELSAYIHEHNPIVQVLINGTPEDEYLGNLLTEMYRKGKSKWIAQVKRFTALMSNLPPIIKEGLTSYMSQLKDVDVDRIMLDITLMSAGRTSENIRTLVLNTDLQFLARTSFSTGNKGSFIIANSKGKYFKTIAMESKYIIRGIIPEIGGYSFIERYCLLTKDSLPGGYTTTKSFIDNSLVAIVSEEYPKLPEHKGTAGLGMHFIGQTAVYNSGDKILGGDRCVDGISLEYFPRPYRIAKTVLIKKKILKHMTNLVKAVSNVVENGEIFSLLAMSTLMHPAIQGATPLTMCLSEYTNHRGIAINSVLFNGVFQLTADVSGIPFPNGLDSISGRTMLHTMVFSDSIANATYKFLRERSITVSQMSMNSRPGASTPPLLICAKEEVLIKDSVVFNFKFKEDMTHERSKKYRDISNLLVGSLLSASRKMRILATRLEYIHRAKEKTIDAEQVDMYYEFFFKILPAMTLCEHMGYMEAQKFHDKAYDIIFGEKDKEN